MKKSKSSKESIPVTRYVGIGASAGGLEAIESFFKNMPPDSGFAFIVIQHLSPDYKSLMVELLSKRTEMEVIRAEEGMTVEANHVYLIPPKQNLTIFHGKLLLKEQTPGRGINLPIDIFLRSLAEDQGEKAVAIILSGTGSDGTRGVRAVKELNGLVIVQDEESAKFDGMPRAAISTGLADFIIPPETMPTQLIACVEHPLGQLHNRTARLLDNEDSLTRIFAELREKTKVDFTYYKPSTINRRIERRITVCQAKNIDDYVRYLLAYPGEVMILYRELLIGVTNFFRDPKAWEVLSEKYLPPLLTRSGNRELRFWTAACSTGEEAYTLAIVVKEAMEKLEINRDVKIFATDLDRDAIITAGSGVYPESIAADMEPELLAKYFYKKGDNYQIVRNIREMVVFAPHNLVNDPPFTKIDLVSCRNMLIYLQPVLQKKAMSMFNFSLNDQGILFLGSSETVGDMADYFLPLSPKYKIYESAGKPFTQNDGNGSVANARDTRTRLNETFFHENPRRHTVNDEGLLISRLMEIFSDRFIPLTVVVNEQLEILYSMGNSEGIFRIPSGKTNFDISKMANKDLSVPLSTGIQKVFRTGEPIIYNNIRLRYMEENRMIRMQIVPMPERKGHTHLVAVFLEIMENKSSENLSSEIEEFDITEQTRQQISEMEQELQFTRENLQATIEELETSNEELQATNEELLASNEELQSTNEELQSTNEELYTVNSEYQNKINELTELNNDVDNLLTGSKIGTLILDENMQIRRFSLEIEKIFKIIDMDLGRPISHLAHQLKDFDLIPAIKKVQQEDESYEEEVVSESNRIYLMRILPYHIGPRTFSGVVVTFIDITEAKQREIDLKNSLGLATDIIEHIPAGLFEYSLNEEGEMILDASNPEAEKMTGISAREWGGKPFDQIWPEAKKQGLTRKFMDVLRTGEIYSTEELQYEDQRVKGGFSIQAFQIPGNRLAVSFEDITSRLLNQEKLRKSEERYRSLFEKMAAGVMYQSNEGEILSVNPAAEKILGIEFSKMSGKNSHDPMWITVDENEEKLPADKHPSMVALRTGKPVNGFIMGVMNPEEKGFRWILINSEPLFHDDEDKPYQVFTTFTDISQQMKTQKALKSAGERLDWAFKTTGMAWWDWEPVANTVTVSDKKAIIAGFKPEEVEQNLDFWTSKIHSEDYEVTMKAMKEHLEGHSDQYYAEYRLKKKDGKYVKLADHGEVVKRDNQGRPLRVIGTVKKLDD
jgi:two-component system CheB/CheR fusion protein